MSTGEGELTPITARTVTVRRMVGPVANNCITLMLIRSGSVVFFSEFGEYPAKEGDVVVLGANSLCGCAPKGYATASVVLLDTDYLVDQFLQQFAEQLESGLDAHDLTEMIYAESIQVFRLGCERVAMMMSWLDELVQLSLKGGIARNFHRMQHLWFLVINQIAPHFQVAPIRRNSPPPSQSRTPSPARREAVLVRDLLHESYSKTWTLAQLASHAHMSTKQLVRVFVDIFGKTPLAYLTMLRVQEMARLLRDTDMTISRAGQAVGWRSRSRAFEAFLEYTGVTPSRYRSMRREPSSFGMRRVNGNGGAQATGPV